MVLNALAGTSRLAELRHAFCGTLREHSLRRAAPQMSSGDVGAEPACGQHERRRAVMVFSDVLAILTACCRGERFCDGHWEKMLESGVVQAALRRLEALSGG